MVLSINWCFIYSEVYQSTKWPKLTIKHAESVPEKSACLVSILKLLTHVNCSRKPSRHKVHMSIILHHQIVPLIISYFSD